MLASNVSLQGAARKSVSSAKTVEDDRVAIKNGTWGVVEFRSNVNHQSMQRLDILSLGCGRVMVKVDWRKGSWARSLCQ